MLNIEGQTNDVENINQSIDLGMDKLSYKENSADINEERCGNIIAKAPSENLQAVCSQLNNDFANLDFYDNKTNFLSTLKATVKNPVGMV